MAQVTTYAKAQTCCRGPSCSGINLKLVLPILPKGKSELYLMCEIFCMPTLKRLPKLNVSILVVGDARDKNLFLLWRTCRSISQIT